MAQKEGLPEAMWDYYVRRHGVGTLETSFGELVTADHIAYIAGHATYNFIPSNFRKFTALSGSASAADRQFKVSTGTSQFGYGAIQSFRNINAKVGRSLVSRVSGYFDAGVDGYIQGIGLVSLGDEISFGYNGVDFGVWHRYGGLAEVRVIEVTAAATGNETLTLTLNGVAYSIPLTSGTVQHNAYEIEAWLNDTANQTVWVADQLDDTVIISALSDGAKSGTYTFSATGTVTGSITQTTAGVTKTSTHIPRSQWNGDKLSSSFDPTKGNVYQIILQNMGYGVISYYIENPDTGQWYNVHNIKNASTTTTTTLGNPSLRCGMYVASLAGSGTDVSCYVDGFYAGIQGTFKKTRNPRAISNTATITTTDETAVLTLRNRRTYNGYPNQVEVDALVVSVSDTELEQNFQTTGTNLVVDADTTTINFTGGRLLAAKSLPPTGSIDIDLQKLDVNVPPSLRIVITVQRAATGGSNQNFTGTATWYEDI